MMSSRRLLILFAAVCACAGAADSSGKITVYINGKPVAHETYSIQNADGKIAIDGSGNADLGMLKVVIEQFKVVTDDTYKPLEAAAKAQMGKANMAVKTTFADNKAKSEIDTGQGANVKEDSIAGDDLVINSNLPVFPWSLLFPRVKLDAARPQEFHAYIIGQTEVPLTVTAKGKDMVEFADRTVELNHVAASLPNAQGQTTNLDFWIDNGGKIVKMTVPSMNAEAYQEGYAPKPKPVEPAQPPAPEPRKPSGGNDGRP